MKRQTGYSLTELLIAAGIVSVMGAVAFVLYQPVKARAQTRAESERLNNLATEIQQAFGVIGSYEGVSSERLIEERFIQQEQFQNGKIRNAWGGVVDAQPFGIKHFGDAFTLDYTNVSAASCSDFVSANAPDTYDVVIDGTSIVKNNNDRLDVAALTKACASARVVSFVYHNENIGQFIASPLNLPQSDQTGKNPPQGPGLAAPGAAAGGQQATPVHPYVPQCGPKPALPSCPGISNQVWEATTFPQCWSLIGSCALPVDPTPAPVVPALPVVVPLPAVPPTAPALCSASSESQPAACLAGSYGNATSTRQKTCPEAWGQPVWTNWETDRSSCQSCPGSAQEETYQTVNRSGSCPSGMTGSMSYQTRLKGTRNVSYACPAGQTTAPSPSYTEWMWTETGEVLSKDESGCKTEGLTVASGKLFISNTNTTRTIQDGLVLAQNADWTTLASVSSDWPQSYGPVRAWANVSFTFNGSTQGFYQAANGNTPSPGNSVNYSEIRTLNFNGKLVDIDFRTFGTSDGTVINGGIRILYRVR